MAGSAAPGISAAPPAPVAPTPAPGGIDSAGKKGAGDKAKGIAQKFVLGGAMLGAGVSGQSAQPMTNNLDQPASAANVRQMQAPVNPYTPGSPVYASKQNGDADDQGDGAQQKKKSGGGLAKAAGAVALAAATEGASLAAEGGAAAGAAGAAEGAGAAGESGMMGQLQKLTGGPGGMVNPAQMELKAAKQEQFWYWYAAVIPTFGLTLLYLHGWWIVGHYVKTLALTKVQKITMIVTDLVVILLLLGISVALFVSFCNSLSGVGERLLSIALSYKSICKPFQPF